MNNEVNNQTDEISFFDLFIILWRRKILIICLTVIGAVTSVLLSIISLKMSPEKSFMPNLYSPQSSVLIDDKSLGGGGFSAGGDIGSMGGLAAIAGIGLSGKATYPQLALHLLSSNTMLDAIVNEFNLIEKYKIVQSPKASSRRIVKGKLNAKVNEKTNGILMISFTDKDPVFARDVVDFCTIRLEKYFEDLSLEKSRVEKNNLEINITSAYQDILRLEDENRKLEQQINAYPYGKITTEINRISLELSTKRQVYSQLTVRLEMLNISLASEKNVLQILEMAEIPDMKSKPSRAKFCMVFTILSGLFAIALSFVLHFIESIKRNPKVIARLRGEDEI